MLRQQAPALDERLLDGCYAADVQAVIRNVHALKESQLLLNLLQMIASQSWDWVKAWSYWGAVCINGRESDCGNYAYSVVWQLISQCPGPLGLAVKAVHERWPCTDAAHNSEDSSSGGGGAATAQAAAAAAARSRCP